MRMRNRKEISPLRIAVLGAGVVGATTAYYLARRGHDVIVLDRSEGVALETSFANGGQVSATGSAPWAAPGVPMQALKWLGRADAPLRWKPSLDWRQWRWLVSFLRRCTQSAYDAGVARNVRLGQLSLVELRALRDELGLDYGQEMRGILKVVKTQTDLDELRAKLPKLEALHVNARILTADQCVELEPALADAVAAGEICGGLHYEDDESGDAHLFAEKIADAAKAHGADFRFGVAVEGFVTAGDQITGLRTSEGEVTAEHVVLCLGTGSVPLAAQLGIRLPVYPVKGYSVSVPIDGRNGAPKVSITDEERRIVVSRLGNTLRAAGMAELAGSDKRIEPRRAEAVLRELRDLFPGGGDMARAEFWTGLRPMTPDGAPLLGPAGKWRNLTLNTGHGTYGWTMACASARIVADLVDGRRPPLDAGAYALTRYRG